MEKDWIRIYISQDIYHVELLRQVLTENGIEAVIINKQISQYQLGNVELYVHHEQADKATEIIDSSAF